MKSRSQSLNFGSFASSRRHVTRYSARDFCAVGFSGSRRGPLTIRSAISCFPLGENFFYHKRAIARRQEKSRGHSRPLIGGGFSDSLEQNLHPSAAVEITIKLSPADYETIRDGTPHGSVAHQAIDRATRIEHALGGV